MPKAPNHPIQVEVIYVLIYMLLGKHGIPLFCHLMLGDKEGYIIYIQLLILLAMCSKILFLNSVPLSLNIFSDPPNLEYTLSMYG